MIKLLYACFSPWWPGFNSMAVHVGFVLDKVAVRQFLCFLIMMDIVHYLRSIWYTWNFRSWVYSCCLITGSHYTARLLFQRLASTVEIELGILWTGGQNTNLVFKVCQV